MHMHTKLDQIVEITAVSLLRRQLLGRNNVARVAFGLCAALFPLFAGNAHAEGPLGFGPTNFTENMETDRPDFTEGTQTVDAGHVQFETGYTFGYDTDGGDKTSNTVPELLTRVGLLDDLELRVAWAGYIREERDVEGGGKTVDEGGADLIIGVKKQLYNQYLVIPKTSMILDSGIPVGGDEVSANDTEPEIKLLWSYVLPMDMGLSGNLNAKSPVEDGERFFEFSTSISLDRPLEANTEGFVEYFGFYPNSDSPQDSSTHYLNTGISYALDENLHLDFRIGVGLSKEAQDLFTGIGVSYRI